MSRSSGSPRIPKYRLHRHSGLAVARFNGVDYYLGKHGSQESRDEYDRLLGEWMMKGRQAPPKTTRSLVGKMSVNELILAYLQFADGYATVPRPVSAAIDRTSHDASDGNG